MAFIIERPDWKSPYTGMGREQWLDACRYYLKGVFQYVPDMESPVLVKRNAVSYTHLETRVQRRQWDGMDIFIHIPAIRQRRHLSLIHI